MRKALIIAALLSSGCSLHLSAELLNPLNKGAHEDKQARKPRPVTADPKPTPFRCASVMCPGVR